jgi:hypothetical protein
VRAITCIEQIAQILSYCSINLCERSGKSEFLWARVTGDKVQQNKN